MRDQLVGFDLAVPNMDDAIGVLRHIVLVRDQDNRVAVVMQLREQRHDFLAV